MKYCLSPWETPLAPPLGFPSGSGDISSYTPPLVTIHLLYPFLFIYYFNMLRLKSFITSWNKSEER